MKYSKSLDLVIAAMTYGRKGDMEKAALCFDKALTMKDLASTVDMLDRAQEKAHTVLTASLSGSGPRKKTTAQLMIALAAKRKAVKAKPPFKGAAPLFKKKAKKKAKADFGSDESDDDEEGEGDGHGGPESFSDITDSMTKSTTSNGPADDSRPVQGPFGGGMSAAGGGEDGDEDEGESEDDLNLDDITVEELPEAGIEDIKEGFMDKMESPGMGIPSVDGEGQPGEGFTETDEDEGEEFAEADEDEDEDTASVISKVKRVQANLKALSRLNKIAAKKAKKK
jgi:hypothetical protein